MGNKQSNERMGKLTKQYDRTMPFITFYVCTLVMSCSGNSSRQRKTKRTELESFLLQK